MIRIMVDPRSFGITDLVQRYRTRRLSPVAVVESYLAAIAAQDGALRSFITVADASARAEATASRQRWAGHEPIGPLDGVPLAIKDNIDVAGLPCTAGVAAFRERVPTQDAPAIGSLRRHGAVILGKLNMHEGAFGATTDNPTYGRCMNPVRSGYTPGGSSGGSGAAVVARLCVAALGTDTMGSVRLPAAYCGAFGFKPSNDAISTAGVVPLSRTLDSVGVLARSVADMVIVASALLNLSAEPKPAHPASLAGLRVGVPQQVADVDMEPEIAAAFERFATALGASGMQIVSIDLSAWQPTQARRAGLLVTEAEAAPIYMELLGAELAGLSPGFANSLRYPSRIESSRVKAAFTTIEAVGRACIAAFDHVDLIALPTAPQTSFPHDGPVPVNQAEFTALANFSHTPAISLPFGTEPLPIGMQLLAAPGQDDFLLSVAQRLEQTLTENAGSQPN